MKMKSNRRKHQVEIMGLIGLFLLIQVGLLMSGCAQQLLHVGISEHTLSMPNGGEVDVVWVRSPQNKMLRCTMTQQGPVCPQARTQ